MLIDMKKNYSHGKNMFNSKKKYMIGKMAIMRKRKLMMKMAIKYNDNGNHDSMTMTVIMIMEGS